MSLEFEGIRESDLSAEEIERFEDQGLIEDDDDPSSNDSANPPIAEIMERRYGRRAVLAGLGGLAAAAAVGNPMTSRVALAAGASDSTLTFPELPQVYDATHHIAEGYEARLLLRWGDAVEADAPAFGPAALNASAQLRQLGYNCDYISYNPLPAGSNNSEHGLLCINQEYTNAHLIFTDTEKKTAAKTLTRDQADVEMAAHGLTVVEVRKNGDAWQVVQPSRYNRRIHVGTPMRLSGHAAGHPRLRTKGDPSGYEGLGTINNCPGGVTPWGTVLKAEENFHGYFGGDPAKTPEARNYKRYGLKEQSRYDWSRFHDRFNVEKEPNEPNRFGWMVEFDRTIPRPGR